MTKEEEEEEEKENNNNNLSVTESVVFVSEEIVSMHAQFVP